uniref:Nuclear pore complex protein Nup98-Nup96 n=1 Tax=Dermatophagoides pteronyssinus TaxID=6956 RepID=A0A6P6Y5W6_DERPT|nr:nuclear pore complex protein Nup98-Nup96-like [Dermatophagoides pteronyssinus]
MFGQSTSTGTFGQPSAFNTTVTPFGSIGNTGQPQSTLFGQTGQQQQQTQLFGNTGLQQPNAGTLFGGQQPQQQQTNTFGTQSAFGGGTSLFGNTASTNQQTGQTQNSLFANANRFGTTTTFGQNTGLGGTMTAAATGTTIKFQPQTSTDTMVKNGQTQSTSINIRLQCITCMREYETKSLEELRLEDYLVGRKGPQQQQQQTTGLFGSSGIGNPTGTSAFGTGGLVSSQPNAFGQTSTGSGGLFGNQQKPFGSIAPTTASTTSIFNSGLSTGGTTGLFGQNTTQPAFGQTNDNKSSLSFFGQQQPGGSTTTQPFSFGQTNTTLGANQQSSSLFGNTGTTSSIFGGQNTLSANKPMFGNSSLQPFGQTQPQQQQTGTSLFGATNTTTGQTGGGIFGSSVSQPSLFNSNQSTLGKTGAFSFPATQTSLNQTSTFNPTSNTTSLFGNTGSTAVNAFGTGTSSGSLFGSNTLGGTSNFSSFGNVGQTGTQPFGSNTNTGFNMGGGTTSTGSAFAFGSGTGGGLTTNTFGQNLGGGGLSTTTGSFFGNPLNQSSGMQQMNNFGTATTGNNVANNNSNAQCSINQEQIMTRLKTMPYGTLPPILSDNSFASNSKTKFTTDPKTLNQYKLNAKSSNEVNKIQRIPVSGKPTTLLFDGLDDESPDNLKTASDIFKPRQNIKKLVLNKSSSTGSNNTTNNQQYSATIFKTSTLTKQPQSSQNNNNNVSDSSFDQEKNQSPRNSSSSTIVAFNDKDISPINNTTIDLLNGKQTIAASSSSTKENHHNTTRKSLDNSSISSPENSFSNLYRRLNFSSATMMMGGDERSPINQKSSMANYVIPKCGVILTRTDYYTIPSLDECDQYYNSDDDSCVVESFTVGRLDYGSIYWPGPLNIKGINLDEIVHIRRKEVIVYPDDDLKPPEGEGLNRPAQITLDQVWPIDKTTREFIQDPERLRSMKYPERLEKVTIKLGATFKEYRPDTGSWVFHVKHFSKYGLDADEDDDNGDEPVSKAAKADQQKLTDPNAKQQSQQTLVKQTYDMNGEKLNAHLNGYHSNELDHDQMVNDNNNIISPRYDSPLSFDHNNQTKHYGGLLFDDDCQKNDEYNLMRSALFVEHENDDNDEIETMSKKCKNLSFTKLSSVTTASQVIPGTSLSSSLFPARFLKATIPKKRRLLFQQQQQQCCPQQKSNAYSIWNSEYPKVRFANGSNKFSLIVGNDVLIFNLDLLGLNDDNHQTQSESIEKLELQFDSHSTVEIIDDQQMQQQQHFEEQKFKIPPLIRTNAYSLNSMIDSNLNLLIEALYGELSETTDYARHQERLRRILKWLYNYNKTLPVPKNSYDRIVHFLTTNELEFAVTECINSKLPRLSYLISCGPNCRKELIMAQLDLWKRSESDQFIEKKLLKIYCILSGLSSWTTSNGQIIDTLDGIEWTQQLTLLLLYKSHQGVEMIGTNLVRQAIQELTIHPNNVEYHMLAQHQPWLAITSADNYLDSWLLQEQLQSYNVIVEDISTNKCDSINIFMASQCPQLYWSLFFALHIRDDYLRTFYVKELLIRNAKQLMDDPDLEQSLREKYYIDSCLLSEAKLYWSRTKRYYHHIATNLLLIGQYKQSHDVFVDRIFPELVINEDYKEIRLLIGKLHPYQHLIPNWNINGAGIYDIFIQLLCFGQSNDNEDGDDDDSHLQHYRKLIENFNVHQLRTPTNRHVLCQSQMARVANIIHAELNRGMYAYHTSVPQDYSLLELRSNTNKLFELKTTAAATINVRS